MNVKAARGLALDPDVDSSHLMSEFILSPHLAITSPIFLLAVGDAEHTVGKGQSGS